MKVSMLQGPFEFWDMASGETRTVRLTHYEEGKIRIAPRYAGAPKSKVVDAMRLHLQEGFKPHVPNYWDITSKLLMVSIRPYLTRRDLTSLQFEISKTGKPPGARFGLSVSRPPAP